MMDHDRPKPWVAEVTDGRDHAERQEEDDIEAEENQREEVERAATRAVRPSMEEDANGAGAHVDGEPSRRKIAELRQPYSRREERSNSPNDIAECFARGCRHGYSGSSCEARIAWRAKSKGRYRPRSTSTVLYAVPHPYLTRRAGKGCQQLCSIPVSHAAAPGVTRA